MYCIANIENRKALLVNLLFIFFFTGCINGQNSHRLDTISTTITSIKPTIGSTGTVVKIKGTHFTGISEVQFFGAKADITSITPTSITTIVPNNARTGNIEPKKKIHSNNRTTKIKGTVFTVDLPDVPVLSSIDKINGTVGTLVTLTGKNLIISRQMDYGLVH